MTNLPPAQLLIGLALSAPREKPYLDHEDSRPWCPLQRANHALGYPTNDLVKLAVALGFSEAAAHGIMRGWDRATGQPPCSQHIADAYPEEVTRGEKLGEQLAKLLGEFESHDAYVSAVVQGGGLW